MDGLQTLLPHCTQEGSSRPVDSTDTWASPLQFPPYAKHAMLFLIAEGTAGRLQISKDTITTRPSSTLVPRPMRNLSSEPAAEVSGYPTPIHVHAAAYPPRTTNAPPGSDTQPCDRDKILQARRGWSSRRLLPHAGMRSADTPSPFHVLIHEAETAIDPLGLRWKLGEMSVFSVSRRSSSELPNDGAFRSRMDSLSARSPTKRAGLQGYASRERSGGAIYPSLSRDGGQAAIYERLVVNFEREPDNELKAPCNASPRRRLRAQALFLAAPVLAGARLWVVLSADTYDAANVSANVH
ncbi:hypothetical protein FB451DRAFT_1391558 [Mycena latifolia]|nr:hypothetical protein FB451DRAFT_1391558 [Mycena latifolia]